MSIYKFETNNNMAARIRKVREENNLSQAQMARLVGTSQPTLSDIEKGKRPATEPVVIAICAKLGVSEEWLRTGERPTSVREDSSRSILLPEHAEHVENLKMLLPDERRRIYELVALLTREMTPAHRELVESYLDLLVKLAADGGRNGNLPRLPK